MFWKVWGQEWWQVKKSHVINLHRKCFSSTFYSSVSNESQGKDDISNLSSLIHTSFLKLYSLQADQIGLCIIVCHIIKMNKRKSRFQFSVNNKCHCEKAKMIFYNQFVYTFKTLCGQNYTYANHCWLTKWKKNQILCQHQIGEIVSYSPESTIHGWTLTLIFLAVSTIYYYNIITKTSYENTTLLYNCTDICWSANITFIQAHQDCGVVLIGLCDTCISSNGKKDTLNIYKGLFQQVLCD